MYNPAAALENDTQKLLWEFDQKTRPNSNQQKKRNCNIVDFAVTAEPLNKTERMWKEELVPRPC